MNWWHRAQNAISQGALTNSKHPDMLIKGAYPTHVSHGHGVYLYDTDDKKYLDYICGLGTNILGYGNDRINKKLMRSLYGGFSHSLPTTQEVITAEKLKELFVFVDRWKFLKSGSEACAAAVKFARAATGRRKIISQGYHGISDQFVSLTPPHKGVPEDLNIFKYNAVDDIDRDTAAIIIEPVIADDSKENVQWLKDLRARCDKYGALLIYDEVITGYRYKNFGVCNNYGITPDLLVIGKAMSNGLPLAAVGAKAKIMDDPQVFVSSTYAGERLSLVAAEAVCEILQKDSEHKISHIWEEGQDFIDRFNEIGGPVRLQGYPTRGVLEGSEEHKAMFMSEMAKAKILFHKSWFYTWGHIPEKDSTLETARGVLDKIRNGLKVDFEMPKSPFSMGVRK